MNRWLKISLWAGLGIVLGLLYGWVISPVEYVDVSPDILRADYKSEYVLMTAEIYQAEGDAARAAARLGTLGPQPPTAYVDETLTYLEAHHATAEDIQRLLSLKKALSAWEIQQGDTQP